MERKPAVVGTFYPSERDELMHLIDRCMKGVTVDKEAVASASSYVAPHAGYVYSGPVAAYTYKALSLKAHLEKIDTFLIMGPNHTGYGTPISVSGVDWNTPFGKVDNDTEFARELAGTHGIEIDESAHRFEHSVEVQLPFLQTIIERPRCVFVCMGDQSRESSGLLCGAINDAEKKLGRKIVVIASSDFNHYESAAVAKGKDMPAIKALEKLNVVEFYKQIEETDDSACGYGPIATAALYAKSHGATRGRLLKYATSGDATGDYDSVVAYASLLFQ
jgi:AmmeMemoRadiSam system protein B